MKDKLRELFSIYDENIDVIPNDSSSELFEIRTEKHGIYYVCAKELTFGGRESLDYEQRIQIKGTSNNCIEKKILEGENGILLGILTDEYGEVILCTFKVKHSTAKNTISKQIKNETINNAKLNGFAQQLKGTEYACAFRKELLYFYLSNTDWIHDDRLRNMNEHVEPVVVEEVSNDVDSEIDRLTTGCNVLLYGVPGSGKSWTIEHEYCKSGSVVERLVFHPDYTYSDFIGQILPAVAEDGQVSYKFTPGPFTNILREAYNNPRKEYILIIEEINRGNAPAIFGEVFQLLDRKVEIRDVDDDGFPVGTSEYGITNMNIAEEMYGKERKTDKVRIPSNLSIIGTMNTSDQNVFTLDTAFQRRWDMRLIENDFANADSTLADAEILDTTVTWRNFCVEINKIVVGNSARMTSAEDKRLGAYFVHLRDLKFNDAMGDLKTYDELRKKESKGTLTDDEKTQIAVIRDAMRQNRKFPEKVIKYLWDDAFKFNREVIFEVTEYQSLEQVIRAFMYAQGLDRFKVFKDNVKDAFTGQDEK